MREGGSIKQIESIDSRDSDACPFWIFHTLDFHNDGLISVVRCPRMSTCPHCSESLPFLTDVFCPFCRELLSEPIEKIVLAPQSATARNKALSLDDNPYASPIESRSASPRRTGVILYTELPRQCPDCDRRFSDANFRRRFKRKLRWTTISYMFLVSMASYFFLAILFPVNLGVIFFAVGNAMTWPKKVKMSCSGCRWKKVYIVAGTGAKRK